MRDLARIVQAKTIRSGNMEIVHAFPQHPTGGICCERPWF